MAIYVHIMTKDISVPDARVRAQSRSGLAVKYTEYSVWQLSLSQYFQSWVKCKGEFDIKFAPKLPL